MHTYWWMWIVFGIIMCLAEILTPGGFYLFFIGITALIVGGLSFFIHSPLIQFALFSILFTLFVLLFRKHLIKIMGKGAQHNEIAEFINESAMTIDPITAGQEGKVELRGSTWTARNVGTTDLPAHAECKILSRDGLHFLVEQK